MDATRPTASRPRTDEAPPAPALTDAARYRRLDRLGRGTSGEVWRARDLLAGRDVALKLLHADVDPDRLDREAAALSTLRVPGVAALLDRGEEGGRPFLVLELAPGEAFPGRPSPVPWEALAPVARALLEVVGGIHQAGFVHRDLKPSNVRVDGHRVTVLDFGLVRGAAAGSTLTAAGTVLGTPRYLAPEQVRGGPIDGRADLYGVGVMLFEALTGRLPHEEEALTELLVARATRPAPSLVGHVAVPAHVARCVDRLLALDPDDRPATATEALVELGEAMAAELPWLGPRDPVDQVLAAVARGVPVVLHGAGGSGRSRVLLEAARVCAPRWLPPGERPFESLRAAAPAPSGRPAGGEGAPAPDVSGGTLAEATAAAERALAALLADRPVFVDDPARLDPWTRALLPRVAGPLALGAPLPSVRGARVRLRSLTRADLRPLFHGPDLCLHLREDGADELHARTAGAPAAVAEEVAAWVRWGLAAWDDGRLRISRASLARLREGVQLPVTTRTDLRALPEWLHEVLAWIAVAWPSTAPDVLARATGMERWRLEAAVAALRERGLVDVRTDGRLSSRVGARPTIAWSASRRREAHRALADALPRGAPGRLRHLGAGGRGDAIPAEVERLADHLLGEGRPGDALAALDLAWIALEGTPRARELLPIWARVVLSERAPAALDRYLDIAGRLGDDGPPTRLVAAVRAAERAGDVSGLQAVDGLDGPLEVWRRSLRVHHLARTDSAAARAALPSLAAVAETPFGRLHLHEVTGRVRYVEGDYVGAARAHARASRVPAHLSGRCSAHLNAAFSWLDAAAPERARVHALAAMRIAERIRHVAHELRARMLVRMADYRAGTLLERDPALLAAAEAHGNAVLIGYVALIDAAVAWRSGDPAAASLAARAAEAATRGGHRALAALATALRHAAGEPQPAPALDGLPPRIARQARALVTRRWEPAPSPASAASPRWEILHATEVPDTC